KLIEAVGVAIGCHTLAESLRELAPRILELTDCEFLKLSQYDPNQDCMITHFWSRDRVRGKCDAFAVDECVTGWVWKHQEAVLIPDVAKEQRFPVCAQELRKRGIGS